MHKCYNYTKIKKGEPNLEKLKNCLDKWGHYNIPKYAGYGPSKFNDFMGILEVNLFDGGMFSISLDTL